MTHPLGINSVPSGSLSRRAYLIRTRTTMKMMCYCRCCCLRLPLSAPLPPYPTISFSCRSRDFRRRDNDDHDPDDDSRLLILTPPAYYYCYCDDNPTYLKIVDCESCVFFSDGPLEIYQYAPNRSIVGVLKIIKLVHYLLMVWYKNRKGRGGLAKEVKGRYISPLLSSSSLSSVSVRLDRTCSHPP